MTEMSDAEFEQMIARLRPAFEEGFIRGRLGLPGDLVIESKWGPVEGTRDGDTVRWTFPDHSWAEVRVLADGVTEIYRNDRLVGRLGPVEIEENEEDQ